MAHSFRPALVALAFIVAIGAPLAAQPIRQDTVEHDDCEANFIAAVGADAYQFSPDHRGELGSGAPVQRPLLPGRGGARGDRARLLAAAGPLAAAAGATRSAASRRSPTLRAGARRALLERPRRGVAPAPLRHLPLHLPGPLRLRRARRRAPSATRTSKGCAGIVEAFASTDEVIVDYALAPQRAAALRSSAKVGSCQVQQHAPIEAGFGYNFYYGSTHAHSNWSDGGQPTTGCTSGNAYGSGTFAPADVYDYARNVAGLDFWVINEHNHLINDAMATNNSLRSPRRRCGSATRTAAPPRTRPRSNDAFVGIYGMEWGVTTNADQGHVTLIETPMLFGWETCTTCNGPNAECTPGTNCYFDVFTPKRFGYLTLYQRSVENPSPAGALGIFTHPVHRRVRQLRLQRQRRRRHAGHRRAQRSRVLAPTQTARRQRRRDRLLAALARGAEQGFHLGPVADHDSHCNNYGVGIPTRTVYLSPTAPRRSLTKANAPRRRTRRGTSSPPRTRTRSSSSPPATART